MKVECLNVCACALEQSLDVFPFQQWKQLLGHEDNRNCKRSAFICVHSIKKLSLLFCKIRKKIECCILPSALISRKTIINKLCIAYSRKHWVQNNQFGLVKEYIWGSFYPVHLIVY